ncbi:hypothetical protein ACFC1R_38220 [Kitasatospora sp. NPDC056138]
MPIDLHARQAERPTPVPGDRPAGQDAPTRSTRPRGTLPDSQQEV